MSRSQISDFFSAGRFHLLDVSWTLPPVLLPVFGFRSCTLPTITANLKKIKEGNYEYPRKVVESADITPITLEQGVQLANSDFYDWIRKAIVGRMPPKNLLIVQFTRINSLAGYSATSAVVGIGGVGGIPGASNPSLLGQAIGGNFEFAVRLPGRAWLLKQCRPTSYKPGSDFDAMSQEISIAQLDIECEEMEEFSLGI